MDRLRQILNRYKNNCKLVSSDAAFVRQNVLDSCGFSDTVKERASQDNAWYCIRPVGYRQTRMLHLCYARGEGDVGAIPLPMAKLRARLKASTCKTAKRSSPARNAVLAACREVIASQISDYREQFWSSHFDQVRAAVANGEPVPKYPRCPMTGKSLWSNATHVDHVYPFVRLVDDWLASIGMGFDQIRCVNSRKLRRMSMGSVLDESWADYHKQHAQLSLVLARANLAKGSKLIS